MGIRLYECDKNILSIVVLAFEKWRIIHWTCTIFEISFSTLGHVVLQILWITNRQLNELGARMCHRKSVSWMKNWVGTGSSAPYGLRHAIWEVQSLLTFLIYFTLPSFICFSFNFHFSTCCCSYKFFDLYQCILVLKVVPYLYHS